jgi:hypothetical protein
VTEKVKENARRAADLRGGWRQAVRRAVDAEQDDLCAGPIPGYNHGSSPCGTRRYPSALAVRLRFIAAQAAKEVN